MPAGWRLKKWNRGRNKTQSGERADERTSTDSIATSCRGQYGIDVGNIAVRRRSGHVSCGPFDLVSKPRRERNNHTIRRGRSCLFKRRVIVTVCTVHTQATRDTKICRPLLLPSSKTLSSQTVNTRVEEREGPSSYSPRYLL
jgi:hypothetical protein